MSATSQPADAVHTSWWDHVPQPVRPYLQLMRLDRPIGTWLLFWPCVFGLILGAAADERRFLEWRDLYYVLLFGIGALVLGIRAARRHHGRRFAIAGAILGGAALAFEVVLGVLLLALAGSGSG